ncbi:hypothetical protein PviCFBP13515_03640 [Pseudomonas viridiflava]|nr:hypothetical protein PviCFBP13507_17915 [Pseudomonas viridiflava]TKK32209.1 hypothetical protein PviCFBP13515_03640 [Pseudomonas viridiflava]
MAGCQFLAPGFGLRRYVALNEDDDAVLKRTISVGGAGFRQTLKSRLVAGFSWAILVYFW